jgi:hypothetical protein
VRLLQKYILFVGHHKNTFVFDAEIVSVMKNVMVILIKIGKDHVQSIIKLSANFRRASKSRNHVIVVELIVVWTSTVILLNLHVWTKKRS